MWGVRVVIVTRCLQALTASKVESGFRPAKLANMKNPAENVLAYSVVAMFSV